MQRLKSHLILLVVVAFAAIPAFANDPIITVDEELSVSRSELATISAEDEMELFSKEIPGFGGLFYDEQGRATVYLTDTSRRDAVGVLGEDVQVLKGRFEFKQLRRYRNNLREVLNEPGVVFLDLDEASNRIRIGVDSTMTKNRPGNRYLKNLAKRVGVPARAVVVSETSPIQPMLRTRHRPVPGGVQVNFGNFVCTASFNVSISGTRYFITNSHCTNIQGGTENTIYHQPVANDRIGREVVDPNYFSGSGCPAGRRCRFADCARVLYDNNGLSNLGRIARATFCGNLSGSLTASGTLSITGAGTAFVGQTVQKTGRTTGCTQGQVVQTNADINVSGTNITLLDQTVVTAGVGGGDSGSPVYIRSGNNATVVGTLWGGSGAGDVFVYSPFGQVANECF